MLTVYIRGVGQSSEDVVPAGIAIISDVESAFISLSFSMTESNKRLVREIDCAELVDRNTVVDRFGRTIYTSCLSTGSKAALLVNNTDTVVDLLECGSNARDAILANCKSGFIVIDLPDISICTVGRGAVDICVNGRRFTDLGQLNDYLSVEILEDL